MTDIQEKAEANGDICNLCQNVLTIKITPIRGQGCYCNQQMCESCFKLFIDTSLDSESDSSESDSSDATKHRCVMGCGILYKSRDYLIADWTELSRLDKLYGNIECPENCGFNGSRKDYLKDHQSDCTECENCNIKVPKSKHTVQCLLCKEEYPICKHTAHVKILCKGPRCPKCRILIYLHNKEKCMGCGKIVKDCISHYKKCPLSTSSGKSIKRCLGKKCSKCDLAHFPSAINQCLSNISLMEKLGLETPYSKAIKEKK